MHVSFVFASVSRKAGGLFGVGHRLAQELSKLEEIGASVLGLVDEFTDQDRALWAPVSVCAFPAQGPTSLGWSPGYQRELIRLRPDVVHAHGLWTLGSFEAMRYARAHRVPYLLSLHGMADPWALRNSRYKKRVAWALYQRKSLEEASALVVTSKREADALRSLGVTAPIALVQNGVDPIATSPVSPFEGRVPPARRTLLFLGRIHPKKGLAELLQGFAHFKQSSPELAERWSLVVTGWDDGGHEARYRALASSLGLDEPSLIWTGPLFGEQRDAVLAHADAFILPSFSEGMPMAVLEALSASTPVLLTPECNLPMVAPSGAGVSITPSAEGVTKGLRELATMSDEARRAMGERGAALVSRSFTWSGVASDTVRIYRWLLGEAEEPSDLLY